MSIFISIASYQDPLLAFTLREAYEKAAWPDELHFGIVDQSPADAPYPVPQIIPKNQVSYVLIDPDHTRGCSWARSLVMSLMGRQDWFLQIDSHMMFEQDWDAILIDKANALMAHTPDCVISAYPAGFLFLDGVAKPQSGTETLRAHVVSPGAVFEDTNPVLRFKTKQLKGLAAVSGFHLAAGCLFASADFVSKFPWDPFLYFNEEEASMAIRLYTHGWTIYHTPGIPILHLYNEPANTVKRPLHWDGKGDEKSVPLWSRLIYRARKRMNVLVSKDSSELGVYALGKARSLTDYANDCGIDYLARTIAQKAYDGPWASAATTGAATAA